MNTIRVLSAAFLALAYWMGGPPAAHAESRFALLIGNQGYNEKVGQLKNPHNDIALVGTTLEKLGFKVTAIKDAGYKAVETALKTHIQQVRRAGKDTVSFIYYSGHGASDPDTQINYLIPVDVEGADDSSLWTNSLELGDIVNKLRSQSPEATHYVVFDACREELRLTREGKKALGAEKGFVPVGNVAGVMVAYATAPGKTASDVGQGAGPYAKALSEELARPGVEAVTMFRNVQLRVKRNIGQDPWLSFPTLPAVYFAGSKPSARDADPAQQIEQTFWESAKERKNPAVLATYLERYPNGTYAEAARTMIQAAREEERKRQEEAKAAEAKRVESASRARALAEELERAEAARKSAEAKVRDDKRGSGSNANSEELRKALEEARIARAAAKAAEQQRLAAVKAAEEAKARVASLPTALTVPTGEASPLVRALQTELKRVGCYLGEVDGYWNAKVAEGLNLFVTASKLSLPTDKPTEAALQATTQTKGRACTPICGSGETAVDGKCVAKSAVPPRAPHVVDVPRRPGIERDVCEGKGWVCRTIRSGK